MSKIIEKDTVDHIPEDFDVKNAKVRISMMVEGDLLKAYKDAAKRTYHGEYQTLMKEKLREAMQMQLDATLQDTISEIKNQIAVLMKRYRAEKKEKHSPAKHGKTIIKRNSKRASLHKR